MKVLFVSSGKSGNVGNVVKIQGESLTRAGIGITYFIIKPGFSGYLKSISQIRKIFSKGKYDIAHAHYGLSGFAAALAGCSPLVVSLMGSDVYYSRFLRQISRFFYKYFWSTTIVKSQEMRHMTKMIESHVIPNGVDLKRFVPMAQSDARKHLDFPPGKKIVLFIASPGRFEKNLELAQEAVDILNDDVELKCIYNVPNSEIPFYLNAADVLLLTSKWEGSVNVIKEAMACNTPIVATNAGDAEWLLGSIPGHFLSSYDITDLTGKVRSALEFSDISRKTKGRRRIKNLGLDSEKVAEQIVQIYEPLVTLYESNI